MGYIYDSMDGKLTKADFSSQIKTDKTPYHYPFMNNTMTEF